MHSPTTTRTPRRIHVTLALAAWLAGAATLGLFAPRAALAQPSAPVPTTTTETPDLHASARPLTLQDAVARALAEGTASRLAAQEPLRAEGLHRVQRAALLPEVDLGATESQTRENLKSIGFNFPGIPSLIGPFGTFEARIHAAVDLIDIAARRRAGAGAQSVVEARAEREVADADVASAVATVYVSLAGAEASVHAAESNLTLFDELRTLANDQWHQGIATRLDSLRAELRWSRQQEEVISARAQRDFARFALLHALALPGDTPVTLADTLADDDRPVPPVEDALARARTRAEFKALDARVAAAEMLARAEGAERYPKLGLSAQGMLNGPDPSDLEPVHILSASVTMPLFDGGRIAGNVAVARAALARARIERAELGQKIEEDVLHTRVALVSATERVRVAHQAESVADEELRVARNRFKSGISTNLEVDNAQTSLATAREDRVRALADQAQARYDLARATGAITDLTRTTP